MAKTGNYTVRAELERTQKICEELVADNKMLREGIDKLATRVRDLEIDNIRLDNKLAQQKHRGSNATKT